jgi:hypothetical protein
VGVAGEELAVDSAGVGVSVGARAGVGVGVVVGVSVKEKAGTVVQVVAFVV